MKASLSAGFETSKFTPGHYYLRPLLSLAETCHEGFSMGGITSLPVLCVRVCMCACERARVCVRMYVRTAHAEIIHQYSTREHRHPCALSSQPATCDHNAN